MSTLEQEAMLKLLGGAMRPAAAHPPEAQFQQWMTDHGIDPRELEVYDFRKAMLAGATRDASGHWPSDFKRDFTDTPNASSDRRTHPAIVVGGFHTQTGQRVPGAPLAKSVEELVSMGWEPATAAQLWASVKR